MLKVWPYWIARPKSIFIAVEGTLIGVLLLHAVWLSQHQPATRAVAGSLGLIVGLFACQVAFHLNKLDLQMLDSKPQIFLLKTLQSVAAGLALTIPLSLVFPRVFTGYGQALIAASLAASSLLVLRPLARLLVKHRKIVEGVLILGREDLASKLYRELVNGNGHFEFKGFIAGPLTTEGANQAGVIIDYRGLKELVLREGISRIVLVEPDPKRREALATTLLGCKLCGVKIEEALEFHERLKRRIWLEALHSEWLIYSDGFKPSRIYIRLKRIIDVACALFLITLTAPSLILIALAVKLTSRGPVLFRQERVGLDGKVFVLCKFRSMRQNAEL
jgi:FlaA1/EpsC-like NDP-sugar epimerase